MRGTVAPGRRRRSEEALRVDRCSPDERSDIRERLPRISLRSCGLLAVTMERAFTLSRHDAPEFCKSFAPKEEWTQRDPQVRARETPGARCTRSPCATGSKHTVVTTGSPKTPGVSCAMVLTAYGALFPATNSSCHRHRRIEGLVAPGRADLTSAGLAPATGAGTTRFCRPQRPRPILRSAMCCRPHFSRGVEAPFVHAPAKCSRTFAQWKIRPAISLRDDAAASTASHPNVRDDRDTPLARDGMARDKGVIWVGRKEEIFLRSMLDRPQITTA